MPPPHRLPDPVRFYLYVANAMMVAAWLVITENVDVHWGWQAIYAAVGVGINLLAAANTTNKSDFAAQAALQQHLEIVDQVNRFAEVEG
jgi:hypothetical protein